MNSAKSTVKGDSSPVRKKAIIVWGNWGPYHYARFKWFKKALEEKNVDAFGLELFEKSNIYDWETDLDDQSIIHFSFGEKETEFPLVKCFTQLLPFLWQFRADVAFVPSYWHWSLFVRFVCKIRGAKIVMMNDSHAGTEKAKGLKRWIKRKIVESFDAALVAGKPHKRHFSKLGLREESIFTGYDAIDVEFFSERANAARDNKETHRLQLKLPQRYFLSLSRMVRKKNLPRLIEAYQKLKYSSPDKITHLVFVGTGPLEDDLRRTATDLDIVQYDHTFQPVQTIDESIPGIHFYGFRQIEENPIFYALAKAFLMPSTEEEWGLVVNEAMACSIPVIVSSTAGSAEDLVVDSETGFQVDPMVTESITSAMQSIIDEPESGARMGIQARRLIQNYNCEAFGKRSAQIIEYLNTRS